MTAWVLVATVNAAAFTLASVAVVWQHRRRRGAAEQRHPARGARTERTSPRADSRASIYPADAAPASILILGPSAPHAVGSAATAAARRAAAARPNTTVATTAGSAGQAPGDSGDHWLDADLLADHDLVIITHDGDAGLHAVAVTSRLGVPTVAVYPAADSDEDLLAIGQRHRGAATPAVDVDLDGAASLAWALGELLEPTETVISIALEAAVPEGAARYAALDHLLMTAALAGPDTEPDAWQLDLNPSPGNGQIGTVTTDVRKIEWRHDGTVGVASAAINVTSEVETSAEVRVRVDPVSQFERAISQALDTPTQDRPYRLTEALLRARATWWGVE